MICVITSAPNKSVTSSAAHVIKEKFGENYTYNSCGAKEVVKVNAYL